MNRPSHKTYVLKLNFFLTGAVFQCPNGYKGSYPPLVTKPGQFGYIGTVKADGQSSSLDSSVYGSHATNSIDITGATTLTFKASPGPREADIRFTFKVKGHTDIIFRYEAENGLSTPSDRVVKSYSYEELSFIIPGRSQKKLVESIVIYISAAPDCTVSVTDIVIYECVSGKYFQIFHELNLGELSIDWLPGAYQEAGG